MHYAYALHSLIIYYYTSYSGFLTCHLRKTSSKTKNARVNYKNYLFTHFLSYSLARFLFSIQLQKEKEQTLYVSVR